MFSFLFIHISISLANFLRGESTKNGHRLRFQIGVNLKEYVTGFSTFIFFYGLNPCGWGPDKQIKIVLRFVLLLSVLPSVEFYSLVLCPLWSFPTWCLADC